MTTASLSEYKAYPVKSQGHPLQQGGLHKSKLLPKQIRKVALFVYEGLRMTVAAQ